MGPFKMEIASLVVGLGLFSGVFLALIAPEELKAGKKYFILLRTVLFVAIVALLVFSYYRINMIITIICLLSLLDLFLNKISDIIRFALLGLFFYLSAPLNQLFVLISVLIFIYGLPAGTLLAHKIIKKKWYFIILRTFIPYLTFLLISNALLFFF